MIKNLDKLILMLSSDVDSEVLASARAIGRALKADGKDWHWLVERLGFNVAEAIKKDAAKNFDPTAELYEKADYVLEHGFRIVREKDFDFIRDLKGQPFFPTARQIKYLNDLYKRVKKARDRK